MKKILALVLAMLLVLGMTSAFAATIKINRDDSWKPTADLKDGEDNKATYTWYRIFDADLDDPGHPVYTISGTDADAKAAALDDTIFTAEKAADGKYYITKVDGVADADVFTALETMVDAYPTLFVGTAEGPTADNPVVIDVGAPGYFFIKASNGKKVAVQTAGVAVIDEKNDYPTINKKQKQAKDPNYTEATVPAEIGKVIDYEITVDLPATANRQAAVVDTMSAGLTYNGNFKAMVGTTDVTAEAADLTSSDAGYLSAAPTGYTIPFQKKFSAAFVTANAGKSIVITYSATVNEDALIKDYRNNKVTLVYDEGNYKLVDEIPYTTYFGGIEKVDGENNTIKLEGVEFTVTVGGAAYNVTPVKDANDKVLYYIPGGSSNTVLTGENGRIIIRGLDNNYTYTLTETKTNKGYNLLKDSKDLTLEEDLGTYTTKDNYDKILNYKGSTLPSTGGMGTTILYIAGSILVLGAVIFLVTKRRMKAED